jgi:hypothetical protein
MVEMVKLLVTGDERLRRRLGVGSSGGGRRGFLRELVNVPFERLLALLQSTDKGVQLLLLDDGELEVTLHIAQFQLQRSERQMRHRRRRGRQRRNRSSA